MRGTKPTAVPPVPKGEAIPDADLEREFIDEVWRHVSAPHYTPEFCVSNVRSMLRLYYEKTGQEPPQPIGDA